MKTKRLTDEFKYYGYTYRIVFNLGPVYLYEVSHICDTITFDVFTAFTQYPEAGDFGMSARKFRNFYDAYDRFTLLIKQL